MAINPHRTLLFTGIGGCLVAFTFSPPILDRPIVAVIGLVVLTGAMCFMGGAAIGKEESARAAADFLSELMEVEPQRDELAQLVAAARTDVVDLLADRGDHDDCPIRDALTVLVDDGPLSIGAYNRARAGLAPADKENCT